ncbi:MAG: hypothetical protein PHS14_04685 [Elusimicrobia bacterium]|nr:hypothetical protein [Elusimicrobiota bacterium]
MIDGDANPGAVSPPVARTLTVIASAMGGGLTMMAVLVFWSYLSAAAKVPTPNEVRSVNALTVIMMVAALIAIVASELVWRVYLRRTPGELGARVRTAFIARLACREGAGLLGMTVAYIAALNGVLRVYPAYWVNLAPFFLFLGFLATHWPSAEKLTAEARAVIGENPSFLKK